MAGNIKSGVNLFGVDGSLSGGGTYNAAVPKTGQTTSYAAGDDGDLEKGVAWPAHGSRRMETTMETETALISVKHATAR